MSIPILLDTIASVTGRVRMGKVYWAVGSRSMSFPFPDKQSAARPNLCDASHLMGCSFWIGAPVPPNRALIAVRIGAVVFKLAGYGGSRRSTGGVKVPVDRSPDFRLLLARSSLSPAKSR